MFHQVVDTNCMNCTIFSQSCLLDGGEITQEANVRSVNSVVCSFLVIYPKIEITKK